MNPQNLNQIVKLKFAQFQLFRNPNPNPQLLNQNLALLSKSNDVVSWTSLISGLSKCGFESKAIDAFSSMNVKPNALTLVSAFSACSSIGALRFGKAIHAYGLKSLIDGNIVF
ncbi:pentatricopeptide repeat-containing protein [Trifolium repens]|nr:pentatricopeptide repeat-containing protein [Trifolium repens]